MSRSAENLVRDALLMLAHGELAPKEAAAIFAASGVGNLAMYMSELSSSELENLKDSMPAVSWEFLKRDAPDIPDVEFGSPAYHAWIESASREV